MKSKYMTIPFDLEKAKLITEGKLKGKIVAENGRDVRIICFDYKKHQGEYIIALVADEHGFEVAKTYNYNGKCLYVEDSVRGLNLVLKVPTYYKDYTDFEPTKNQPCLVRDGEEDVWWVQVCAGKNAVGDVVYYTPDGGTETWVYALPLNKATERLIGTSKSYFEILEKLEA